MTPAATIKYSQESIFGGLKGRCNVAVDPFRVFSARFPLCVINTKDQ